MRTDNNNWRKCEYCGKFLSYKQMDERKDVIFHFIPDSEFTTEESYWIHKNCWQRLAIYNPQILNQ